MWEEEGKVYYVGFSVMLLGLEEDGFFVFVCWVSFV